MYRRYPPLRDQLKEPLTLMMLAAFAVIPLLAGVRYFFPSTAPLVQHFGLAYLLLMQMLGLTWAPFLVVRRWFPHLLKTAEPRLIVLGAMAFPVGVLVLSWCWRLLFARRR